MREYLKLDMFLFTFDVSSDMVVTSKVIQFLRIL